MLDLLVAHASRLVKRARSRLAWLGWKYETPHRRRCRSCKQLQKVCPDTGEHWRPVATLEALPSCHCHRVSRLYDPFK